MTGQPAVPGPLPADLERDAAKDYCGFEPFSHESETDFASILCGYIRLAAHYRAALDAERRAKALAEERYDKTFHFFNVMESERDQMEAQRDALATENAALRQEVAGLQKSADQLRADLRTAAERVAAQSELLSRRAAKGGQAP